MSLSNQVKESVKSAAECLRDALAFAARTEHPITINMLSDVLSRLESLEHMDDIMEHFGKQSSKKEI
jgi:chromosomal replication initiation ATPase DnaA